MFQKYRSGYSRWDGQSHSGFTYRGSESRAFHLRIAIHHQHRGFARSESSLAGGEAVQSPKRHRSPGPGQQDLDLHQRQTMLHPGTDLFRSVLQRIPLRTAPTRPVRADPGHHIPDRGAARSTPKTQSQQKTGPENALSKVRRWTNAEVPVNVVPGGTSISAIYLRGEGGGSLGQAPDAYDWAVAGDHDAAADDGEIDCAV